MASSFRYLQAGKQHGPVSFRELVQLVRSELIQPDDLVMADWQSEWKPAVELVGLFHTAGRDDVLIKWEAEQREQQRRLIELTGETTELSGETIDELLFASEQVQRASLATYSGPTDHHQGHHETSRFGQQEERGGLSNEMEATIRDALAATENKRSPWNHPLTDAATSILSRLSLNHLFRCGMALVAANFAAIAVYSWSETELLRHPDRGITEEAVRIFPVYGRCSDVEYVFLMVDLMLVAGLIGYGMARILELFSDDAMD